MTGSGTPAGPFDERALRVVHVAILLGLVALVVFMVVMRSQIDGMGVELGPNLRTGLRCGIIALTAINAAVIVSLRRRLPHASAGEGHTEWWRANGARVVLLWAIADGVGVLGAVVFLFTGDLVALTVAFGWATLALLVFTPRRLVGDG